MVISVDPGVADRVIEALALDDAQLRAGVLVGPAAEARQGAPVQLPDLALCEQSTR